MRSFLLALPFLLTACAVSGNNENSSNTTTGDAVVAISSSTTSAPMSETHVRMRLISPEGEDMGEIWWPKNFKPETE